MENYYVFLILLLSFLMSLLSNKSIKTFSMIWIIVLLFNNNNNSVDNIIPSKAQASLTQKSKANTLMLIILDEYSSPSELKNYLPENDLNDFTNYLTKNNWHVKENLITNELSTSLSIYSLFNYNVPGDELQNAKSEIYSNFLGEEAYENSLIRRS